MKNALIKQGYNNMHIIWTTVYTVWLNTKGFMQ